MMLGSELGIQTGIGLNHGVGSYTVATCTGGNETFQRRKLVFCTVKDQPLCDGLIAIQCGKRVGSAAVWTTSMDIRAVVSGRLNHREVQAWRRNVQGSVARLAPGKVRVGTVLQQPANTRGANDGVHCPTQDVA